MAIVLPTEKVPAKVQDPKRLIIFSKPKRGKTTALAALDNCLIVDTENGSNYVNALKVQVQSIQDINELCKQLNVHFGCGNTLISCERCTEEIQAANSVSNEEYREIMKLLHRIENKGEAPIPLPIPQKINTSGITCSAGRSSAFINYEGMMLLCVSYQEMRISTFEHSVKDCWREVVKAADQIPYIEECNGCIHGSRCIQCFGAHYYDTGNFTIPSPKLCFKRKHPEEAARVEAYFAEHGVLPPAEF